MTSGQARVHALTSPDTVRILALMVEFQTDTDEKTTGNGKLLSTSTPATDTLIDPPPS